MLVSLITAVSGLDAYNVTVISSIFLSGVFFRVILKYSPIRCLTLVLLIPMRSTINDLTVFSALAEEPIKLVFQCREQDMMKDNPLVSYRLLATQNTAAQR